MIDDKNLKEIGREVQDAISMVESEFNVRFNFQGIEQRGDVARFILDMRELSVDGESAIDPWIVTWNAHATKHGFNLSDRGKTFHSNTRTFKLLGLKPRNTKYPVIAENVRNGRSYKFRASSVLRYLAAEHGSKLKR